jgi:PIN like domain
MRIPVEIENSSDFTKRVGDLLSLDDTLLYVDTSFLMWLTKIGRTSRGQLLNWLTSECPGRVHVPVWAAHEYLRHHVEGTILNDLDRLAKELDGVASRTYARLRPYLDDLIIPGVSDAQAQQVAAREALNELQRLAESAKGWNGDYMEHATQVIAFINDHVPDKTPVFEYMSGIEAIGLGRFDARLPPGFQDRRKRESVASHRDNSAVEGFLGSNRWGDLILWKEILDHAAEKRSKAIIVLTNDRKNDWYFGVAGTKGVDRDLIQLRSSWKPVPCAHPMLSLEARGVGVNDLVLLDAPYLGALLRTLGGDDVKEFIDVAIVPDPPARPDEAERREALVHERLTRNELERAERAAEAGFRFPDGPQMLSRPAIFARALYDSRKLTDENEIINTSLRDIEATIDGGDSIADLITKEFVDPLDNSMLTTLGRELHDRGLNGIPGYGEALTDLVSLLGELPESTAASLYLGLIASMYLERPTNLPRLPPRSPVASLLFERQNTAYAQEPISALKKKFANSERLPLYLPDAGRPSIDASLDIVTGTDDPVILNSVRLASEEVFTRAQPNAALRLVTLFDGRSELLGKEIVMSACEHFAVPFDQVTSTDDFDRIFSVDPTAGFKDLRSVYVDSEGTA